MPIDETIYNPQLMKHYAAFAGIPETVGKRVRDEFSA